MLAICMLSFTLYMMLCIINKTLKLIFILARWIQLYAFVSEIENILIGQKGFLL